jgi:hypothetical protein
MFVAVPVKVIDGSFVPDPTNRLNPLVVESVNVPFDADSETVKVVPLGDLKRVRPDGGQVGRVAKAAQGGIDVGHGPAEGDALVISSGPGDQRDGACRPERKRAV